MILVDDVAVEVDVIAVGVLEVLDDVDVFREAPRERGGDRRIFLLPEVVADRNGGFGERILDPLGCDEVAEHDVGRGEHYAAVAVEVDRRDRDRVILAGSDPLEPRSGIGVCAGRLHRLGVRRAGSSDRDHILLDAGPLVRVGGDPLIFIDFVAVPVDVLARIVLEVFAGVLVLGGAPTESGVGGSFALFREVVADLGGDRLAGRAFGIGSVEVAERDETADQSLARVVQIIPSDDLVRVFRVRSDVGERIGIARVSGVPDRDAPDFGLFLIRPDPVAEHVLLDAGAGVGDIALGGIHICRVAPGEGRVRLPGLFRDVVADDDRDRIRLPRRGREVAERDVVAGEHFALVAEVVPRDD